jgi:cysteine-rich repeat protein
MRVATSCMALALGVVLALVSYARAHEAKVGMATETLVLKAAGARKLVFKGFGDTLTPNPEEDPGEVGAGVLVRGGGAGGAGRSAFVTLDPARWKAREKHGTLRYAYKDRKGTRGGVRQVVFERGGLTIKAGGPALSWTGNSTPEHVEVLFRIGREWHCASAAGKTTARGFRAKNQFAPAACPLLVCGDGTRELGEACDDGNIEDGDACTNACVRGACEEQTFQSSWEAIHALVIERHGCTQAACHGSAPGQGGLDLRFENAYANLLEVPSSGSADARVSPGAPRRSSLWKKLAAKTDPGSVEITGTPMPSGLPPVSDDELEALRLWIYAGAPEDGVVDGIQDLLDACLPDPTPIEIAPLEPPPPDEGMQFRMPEYPLPAHNETEVCFAQYFDLSTMIPQRFLTPDGTRFYTNGGELRQDPHSHHLQIIYVDMPAERLSDPVFGAWTCKGGALDGQPCEPTDTTGCGEGLCGSTPTKSVACIGYGPPEYAPGLLGSLVGGAQTAQSFQPAVPGFWSTLPVKGVLYWNSHAFNLTGGDTRMHAYDNHLFTDDLRYQQYSISNIATVYYPAGTLPFTERTVCENSVLPQGARLLWLNSHTHKRARRFWVELHDGSIIYESLTYSDPETATFDPPRLFDSPDAVARTLHYCATYNNGVAADGSPDPTTVRRRSVTPTNGVPCHPVACVAGRIGADCAGPADDATCDSAPGAGDGWCDACPITAGVTTEDEMFLLFGGYVLTDIE